MKSSALSCTTTQQQRGLLLLLLLLLLSSSFIASVSASVLTDIEKPGKWVQFLLLKKYLQFELSRFFSPPNLMHRRRKSFPFPAGIFPPLLQIFPAIFIGSRSDPSENEIRPRTFLWPELTRVTAYNLFWYKSFFCLPRWTCQLCPLRVRRLVIKHRFVMAELTCRNHVRGRGGTWTCLRPGEGGGKLYGSTRTSFASRTLADSFENRCSRPTKRLTLS